MGGRVGASAGRRSVAADEDDDEDPSPKSTKQNFTNSVPTIVMPPH